MSEINTTYNVPSENLETADNISAPVYPGTALRTGSNGENVRTMQRYLNGLGVVYTAVNRLNADGKFGASTRNAVIRFQKQFDLNPDGVIGKNTWNAIVAVYLSVAGYRPVDVSTKYQGLMSHGSRGDAVRFLQSYLNAVKKTNGYTYPNLNVDGVFGNDTALAVAAFQSARNLAVDGKVGRSTWAQLVPEFNRVIKL